MEEKKEDVIVPEPSAGGGAPAGEPPAGTPNPEPQKPPQGYVPKQALDEERRKIKLLEDEIARLKELAPSEDDFEYSDEGKVLGKKISSLETELQNLRQEKEKERIFSQYPQIKERVDEFNDFLAERSNLSVEDAADLFRIKKGLIEEKISERKGLERPTGGPKTNVPESGYTSEEARRIRENDPKLYEKLVREGKLKIIIK